MRNWTLLAIALALTTVAAPAQAVHGDGIVGVEVHPDREPTTDHPDHVALSDHEPGQRYNWTVNVTDDYQVVDLAVHDGFNLTRTRQLVPLVDGGHFVELHQRNVTDVDRPAKVFNLTTEGGNPTYRLGIPGPGERNLTLHRDETPPTVSMGPVRNVTHFSFDVRTDTSEPAMAELVLAKPDGSVREQPTPKPGTFQNFPVQGLDADTTYTFHVEVWDWSGNRARTDTAEVTTAPEPNPPEPVVTPVAPEPGATVPATGSVLVEATFEANGSAIQTDGVRLFFDKEGIERGDFTVEDGKVLYRAVGPFQPREYSVAVEVPNEAGGTGIARWSFTVEGAQQANSPLGLEVALVGLVGLALLRARRR